MSPCDKRLGHDSSENMQQVFDPYVSLAYQAVSYKRPVNAAPSQRRRFHSQPWRLKPVQVSVAASTIIPSAKG